MRSNSTVTSPAKTALAVFLVGLCACAALARAQTPEEIAGQIPLSVVDVIVGGHWGDTGTDGVYRAVLTYRMKDGEPVSDVLVQWITFGEDSGRVVHSEKISSLTGEPATTAFIAFDFGEADEATRLLIGSYDPEDEKDNMRFVRLGDPAEFEFVSPTSGQ
ncbi:MAG: hypothetical protein ACLFPA_09905 [Dichotomicrobium sp.]